MLKNQTKPEIDTLQPAKTMDPHPILVHQAVPNKTSRENSPLPQISKKSPTHQKTVSIEAPKISPARAKSPPIPLSSIATSPFFKQCSFQQTPYIPFAVSFILLLLIFIASLIGSLFSSNLNYFTTFILIWISILCYQRITHPEKFY